MKSKYINNSELGINNIGKVTVHGFVANKRRFGELTFIDLRDRSGDCSMRFQQDI